VDSAGYLQELLHDGRRVLPVRRAIQTKSVTSSICVVFSKHRDVRNVTADVDEQYCQMKFGSWTFSGRQVTLEWYEDYRQVNSVSLYLF